MPLALEVGISYDEFWKSNPHKINLLLKNRIKEKIEIDEMMHVFGYYIQSAVANAIGSAFEGRKHKNSYPKEPFMKKIYEESIMTEEELAEKQLREMLASERAWQMKYIDSGLPMTKID